jgi:hypothetical protein
MSSMTTNVTVDRPDMPAGYGPADDLDGTLPWSWAAQRLIDAGNYWVATVSTDGAPHVAPVWGVWLHGALWFGTDPQSAKGRNLARGGRVIAHLESGDEAVIVHGRAQVDVAGAIAPDMLAEVDDAYAAKYVDPMTGDPVRLIGGGPDALVYRVVPDRVLGWLEHDFPRTRTRWRITA